MLRRILNKITGKRQFAEPDYLKYIENKGAIFRPGFSVRIDVTYIPRKYIHLGSNSILSCNIIFESDKGVVKMGNNNSIGNSTFICRDEIILEDNIFISWGCTICDHNFHSLDYLDRRNDFKQILENVKCSQNLNFNKNWNTVDTKPIKICSDAWIGMNVVIMKGVTIGRGAIVGANSVVTKNVPDFTVVAGNPAQEIKKIPENN